MGFLVGATAITLELVVTAERLGVAEISQTARDRSVLETNSI